jgi:hypothetical protein
LGVEGFSASLDAAHLVFEEGELRFDGELRKKAAKMMREHLHGEWLDSERIFVFSADRSTARALLRVCANSYPLVQFNDQFLSFINGEDFVSDAEDDEAEQEEPVESVEAAPPEAAVAEDADEEKETEPEPEPDQSDDPDLLTQVLSNIEKPLTRKAFWELVDATSKYDLALAELAPEDIKDQHLARLWEIYMAAVGTALVADTAIDQYLADRKAASEMSTSEATTMNKRKSRKSEAGGTSKRCSKQ